MQHTVSCVMAARSQLQGQPQAVSGLMLGLFPQPAILGQHSTRLPQHGSKEVGRLILCNAVHVWSLCAATAERGALILTPDAEWHHQAGCHMTACCWRQAIA